MTWNCLFIFCSFPTSDSSSSVLQISAFPPILPLASSLVPFWEDHEGWRRIYMEWPHGVIRPACCSEQTLCFLGGALSSLMLHGSVPTVMGHFFIHLLSGLPSHPKTLSTYGKSWTHSICLVCFSFDVCAVFWYNKQGKSNEVNSVRFKEFLTNEQCLTVFCFENVNP